MSNSNYPNLTVFKPIGNSVAMHYKSPETAIVVCLYLS